MENLQATTRAFKLIAVAVAAAGSVALVGMAVSQGSLTSLFVTSEQRAQRFFDRQDFDMAADLFTAPMPKSVALFRAGEFKEASLVLGRINTGESHFNHGNALVMMGKYDAAIAAFDRALEFRSDWEAARENREIARLRAARTARSGGEMTGGKLEADEIVFEPGKAGENSPGDRVETDGGDAMSQEELQSLWLRRVQTRGADFLRVKFAQQLVDQEKAPAQGDRP
ncbi:MAG: tetratricopeptide repeat protein [Planctomycetota bacterium]|jgi:Ca-activated chloride channel family protein